MKKLYPILIISLLFLSVGLSQQEYDINHIIERDGVYVKKFSDERISGKVFQMFGDVKVPLGMVKDGKKEGKWRVWNENEQMWGEGTFKDGKKDGLWVDWKSSGQKRSEGTYKDGERDGLWTYWYENGQKKWEATYKDGKEISYKCWDEYGILIE